MIGQKVKVLEQIPFFEITYSNECFQEGKSFVFLNEAKQTTKHGRRKLRILLQNTRREAIWSISLACVQRERKKSAFWIP